MNARYQTLILTAALLSAAGPAAAESLLELKDPQGVVIKGESTDPKHKDKIVIDGFSLGVSSSTNSQVRFSLQLDKPIDKTSPLHRKRNRVGTGIADHRGPPLLSDRSGLNFDLLEAENTASR